MLVSQPPLAASVGSMLLLLPRVGWAAIVRAAAALVAVLPSSTALPWYAQHVQDNYRYLEAIYPGDDAYLAGHLAGYTQTREVLASPAFARRPLPRVLVIRVDTEYYFRRAGVETVGDWFGPGRYRDLVMMLENDRLPSYIQHFDIGGVIVRRDQGGLDERQVEQLRAGLARIGFRTLEDEPHGFYVAVRVPPAPRDPK